MKTAFLLFLLLSSATVFSCRRTGAPKKKNQKAASLAGRPLKALQRLLNKSIAAQSKLLGRARPGKSIPGSTLSSLLADALPGWTGAKRNWTPIGKISGLRGSRSYRRGRSRIELSIFFAETNRILNSLIEEIARYRIESTEGFMRRLDTRRWKEVRGIGTAGIEQFDKKTGKGRLLFRAGDRLIFSVMGHGIQKTAPLSKMLRKADWNKIRSLLATKQDQRTTRTIDTQPGK